jgi:predicted ferric reductase
MVTFWFMLAVSVELWWLDTPARSLHSTGAMMTESGRIVGMVAGFLLLAQVLAMSRVRWLERWIGAHDLLTWHRELGAALLIVVLAHVILITLGYASESGVSVIAETGDIWHTLGAMVSAYIATGILVAVAILSIRQLRRRMPYELWYYVHLTSYLVLLLSYGHQFADGQELSKGGFGHWYWATLYVFVLACLIQGRIIGPLTLNLRHRLRVADVVAESDHMVSIYIDGRRLEDLDVQAGQYFRWRFLARGHWWQAHPFSLSAAPNGRWLRLTVKAAGDHTSDLQYLRPGVRVFAEGPWGIFTAEHRRRPAAMLIAGGSGIAPIRALMEELPTGTIVLYRARSMDEIVFRDELEWLAEDRRATLWYVLGSRDDPEPKRAFSPEGMREFAPDLRHRDVYLCGPPGIVDAAMAGLRRLRVPRRQIHMDPFEF